MRQRGKRQCGKRFFASMLCVLCVLWLCAAPSVSAAANSAPAYWFGTDAAGSIVLGENCPLTVENEELLFSIDDFPFTYYSEDDSAWNEYVTNVTARYTFYNPADYDVTAELAFPFGRLPSYMDRAFVGRDTARYAVTVGDEAVQKTLRHTYSAYGDSFSVSDMHKLCDGYIDDDFYAPELPVTAYAYTFDGIVPSKDRSPYVSAVFTRSNDRRVALSDNNGGRTVENGVALGMFAENGDSCTVYAIGEPFAQPPAWTVYENGAEKKVIAGTATLKYTQTMTFEQFVLRNYAADGGISRTDWYNAVVAQCNERSTYDGIYIGTVSGLDVTYDVMRWYTYTLRVPAGARVVNTVTAPLYPHIDGGYNPFAYTYTYLLSPAKLWEGFDRLRISVQTPYYMLESKGFEFVAESGCFTWESDGLPNGELTFTLCADPNPQRVHPNGSSFLWIILLFSGGIVLAVVVLSLIFYGIHRLGSRKKKAA